MSDQRLIENMALLEAEIERLRRELKMTVDDLDFVIASEKRLRAALEEIASHLIDSELASREKRGMARKALANELKSTLADETASATSPATAAKPGNDK